MALVAALKDASYITGDMRTVSYAVTAGSEEAGWLLCDGRPVVRATYQALFAKIGTTYNIGGEAGTDFRLPDARGRSMIGTGQGSGLTNRVLGIKGGAETHPLVHAEMPRHNHGGATGDNSTGTESADHAHGGTTDGGGTHAHGTLDGSNFAIEALINNAATGTVRNSVLGEHGSTGNAGDHAHNFGTGGRNAAHAHYMPPVAIGADGGTAGQAIGNVTAHNNMPPFLAVSVLIKT